MIFGGFLGGFLRVEGGGGEEKLGQRYLHFLEDICQRLSFVLVGGIIG